MDGIGNWSGDQSDYLTTAKIVSYGYVNNSQQAISGGAGEAYLNITNTVNDVTTKFFSSDIYGGVKTIGEDLLALGVNNTDIIWIEVDGKVGIGIRGANATLDVNGNINTNSYYNFTGGGYMYDNGTTLILGHT